MKVTLSELAKESTEKLEERRAFLRVRMEDLGKMLQRYRKEFDDVKYELTAVSLNLRARATRAEKGKPCSVRAK
jgi:chaperonin cofactor prefoldin